MSWMTEAGWERMASARVQRKAAAILGRCGQPMTEQQRFTFWAGFRPITDGDKARLAKAGLHVDTAMYVAALGEWQVSGRMADDFMEDGE